jgi:hypothetical protein
MSTTKALNGLTPSRKRGSGANSTGANSYRIESGFGTNIFNGDIVCNADGYVVGLSVSTQKAIGVFTGCQYVANGEQKFSNYWPWMIHKLHLLSKLMLLYPLVILTHRTLAVL